MRRARQYQSGPGWAIPVAAVAALLVSSAALADAGPEAPTAEAVAAARGTENEEPAGAIGDEILVTAGRTEQRLRDLPVQATVLGPADLERSAAGSTDDFLRQLPSFNSQRPGSSRGLDIANQGISLRGLGGSSASRALVVVDGVPLNEPFASWVSWSRAPLASLERVEVVPGGGGGAWGNQALGGVIQLFTRRPSPAALDADLRYGSRNSFDGTVLGSHVSGPLAFSAHLSHFDTDGHHEIPEPWRGPVDTPIALESSVADARLELTAGDDTLLTAQATYLLEERTMGTALSADDLDLFSIRFAAERTLDGGGVVSSRLFGVAREAWNRRGNVNDDHTEVTPRRDQFDNPSRTLGADLAWSRPLAGAEHLITAGIDGQWTESELHENTAWTGTQWGQRFDSAGDQILAGAYIQDSATLGTRTRLAAGGRVDLWRSENGVFLGTDLVTGATLYDSHLDNRSEIVFSPNLGLRFDATESLDIRAAVYQSFRAPTPNELLKSSPSSRAFLAANNELDPERVRLGFEAGFDWTPAPRTRVRLSGFWTDVSDAILDVTVGVAGDRPEVIEPCGLLRARGVCQQRQNVEGLRARGIETDFELRPAGGWRIWGSYTFTDSTIVESNVDQALEGKFVRRVPEHQGTVQLTFDSARLLSSTLQLRYQGERFEDNTNTLVIGDAWIADLRLSRALPRGLELLLTVENLLDTEIETGRNDDYGELAAPRTFQAGVRWRFRGDGAGG